MATCIRSIIRLFNVALKKIKNKKNLHGEVFNFGPNNNKNYNVISLVIEMKKYWEKVSWKTIIKTKNKEIL